MQYTQPTTSLEGDDKPAYADAFNGPSDIAVDIIKQHIVSGIVQGGFVVDHDGCLMHSAVVEDDGFEVNDHLAVEVQSIVLHQAMGSGCGQWKKKPSKSFGGLDWDWDECIKQAVHSLALLAAHFAVFVAIKSLFCNMFIPHRYTLHLLHLFSS